MDILEKKINDIDINVLKNKNEKQKKYKGNEIFSINPYICFIASKKKSGKTQLIFNIIQNTCDEDTIIYIFCGTHNIDSTWKNIIKYLDSNGNDVNVYDSIYEGKVNHLENVINELTNETNVEKKVIEKKEENKVLIEFGKPPPVEKPVEKPKRKKLETVKYLFIFDDVSSQLKNPAIARFLKIHRHYNSSVIISTQYIKDLNPASITQIDYFICFKNFSIERLQHIHKLVDLSIDFEDFLKLYYHATKIPYEFLFINVRDESIRRCFHTLLSLKSS